MHILVYRANAQPTITLACQLMVGHFRMKRFLWEGGNCKRVPIIYSSAVVEPTHQKILALLHVAVSLWDASMPILPPSECRKLCRNLYRWLATMSLAAAIYRGEEHFTKIIRHPFSSVLLSYTLSSLLSPFFSFFLLIFFPLLLLSALTLAKAQTLNTLS